jgi:predicted Zn-dependent protease
MYISTGLEKSRLLAVLHEQGHALGLDHSDIGIMAKHGSSSLGFSSADLAECFRAGVCD